MLACAPVAATAAEFSSPAYPPALQHPSPLPTRQMNPAMLRYLDPIPESAWPSTAHGLQLSLNQHYSTVFLADSLPAAPAYLADMELYVADVEWRWRMDSTQISLTTPIMRPNAGVFDGFLRQYHNTLGLPNGGRELRPDNQFAYRYPSGNWQGRNRWELGNVQIKLRQGLAEGDDWTLAGIATMQLPSASHRRGWAHQGVDGGLGLAVDKSFPTPMGKAFVHAGGWWLHPFEKTDSGMATRDYMRSEFMLAINTPMFSIPLQWLAQIQGGSSPYQSGIAALDQQPWLLSFAMRVPSANGMIWSLGFAEGITQHSTQDFGLLLSTSMELGD